jgi:hypothetical protein
MMLLLGCTSYVSAQIMAVLEISLVVALTAEFKIPELALPPSRFSIKKPSQMSYSTDS